MEERTEPVKVDEENIQQVATDRLELDSKNHRLAWRVEERKVSQKQLLEILWNEMSADELAASIAGSGFHPGEPLYVVPKDETISSETKFTVVEGNRRLSAVRVLRNSEMATEIGATRVPDISESEIKNLEYLPVLVYPDRKSLWETVGYRHIAGIKQWSSLGKAEYIREVHEKHEVPVEELADRIGDAHETALRLIRGYNVLDQAIDTGCFEPEKQVAGDLTFSYLYTAVSLKGFRDFLGVEAADLNNKDPVTDDKLPELKKVFLWLYGDRSEDIDPVVTQINDDLYRLNRVLQKPQAIEVFEDTENLARATDVEIGKTNKLKSELKQARGAIIGAIDVFDAEEMLDGEEMKDAEAIELLNDVAERLIKLAKKMQMEFCGDGDE